MITGEYPTVLRRSRNRKLLEELHGILITEKEALEVVYSYLDEHEFETGVRFTGRGRCEYRGDQVNMRLPSESSGRLTLGLTLHEIAHGLGWVDHKIRNHTDRFVKIFDNLAESEWTWRNEHKRAA